ncbi:MAG: hypothetical protein QM599_10870 [Pseudoxanthomonas sp.]
MTIPFPTWLLNVRSIVQAFSDADFQDRAWNGVIPTSFNSPDEMISVYFDDIMVPEFVEQHAVVLGADAVDAERQLSSMLETYSWPIRDGFIDQDVLLKQYDWHQVRKAAHMFLAALENAAGCTS